MTKGKRNRSGLTLIEVVVVILILLVLAALLLPSVRRSGEAARRSQCKSYLKQMGLALLNYHDVHQTFPPGWIASDTRGQSSGFGWQFQMLPFFEPGPLYKKFDSKLRLADQTSDNSHLASTVLTSTRCPTDQGIDPVESRWIPKMGTTNYVGNFGVGIPTTYSVLKGSEGKLVDPRHCQGIFGANSRVRTKDVHDGLANVIFCRRTTDVQRRWRVANGASPGKLQQLLGGNPQRRRRQPAGRCRDFDRRSD